MKRDASFFAAKHGRRDTHHAAIRDGLEALGHLVMDCASVGDNEPDLCVFPRTGRGVEWVDVAVLEVKSAGQRQTPEQVQRMNEYRARGIRCGVVHDLDEALETLKKVPATRTTLPQERRTVRVRPQVAGEPLERRLKRLARPATYRSGT